MRFAITHPTRAEIFPENDKELQELRKKLTYTNKSVQYQIHAHRKRNWLRKKDPEGFDRQLSFLQSQLKDCLVFKDQDKFFIRPGSLHSVLEPDCTVHKNIMYPMLSPLPWKKKPEFEPYPYQLAAVTRLLEKKHANISLPTGCGKSFILLMIAKSIGKNVVVVTPSKSIFNELLIEFQTRLGKNMVGGYGDSKKDIKKPITIAIGKSLTMLEKDTPQWKFFNNKKAMLVDESHTFAANQLEKVCHGVLNDTPYRIFVSATQTRNDGTEKLLQSIIGPTVLEMTLEEAIKKDYLCPLNFHIIRTFSKHTMQIKDPIAAKRKHFLYNENIAETAAKIANASWRTNQESTLILVEELKQIQLLKRFLKAPFAYVHAGSKKEAEKFGLEKVKLQEQVDKFNKGEVRTLVGTSCIATGTNLYPVHNAINWMGGSSEIVTKQGAMGRSTRLLEKSQYVHLHKPKPFARIFDFWLEGQHMLNKQLEKRISWYKEANSEVKFY